MKKRLVRKGLVLGIIVMIVGAGVIPSLGGTAVEKKSNHPISNGYTLYVGGSGEGNYTKIQDAIDDANDGDTVFVYDDSSPYQLESYLNIEKSINLIGEDRDTTVIDGSINNIDGLPNTDVLIFITTDWVNISGFTIQNSERCGITVYMGDNINISGNIFIDHGYASIGILISNYSYISDNILTSTKDNFLIKDGGLSLEHVSFTTIIGNIFTNCDGGIALWSSNLYFPTFTSDSNIISGNLFDNNNVAMQIIANNTLITRNTISNHTSLTNLIIPALSLEGCNNTITCNNFINNIRDANNVKYIFSPSDIFKIRKNKNVWDGNYWGRPRSLPRFIFSYIRYERGFPDPSIPIPWISFDLHPAKEPYDIYSKVEDAIVTAHGISGQIKLILIKGGQNYGEGYEPSDVNIFIDGHKVTPIETWVVGGEILLGQDATGTWIVGGTCPPGDYSVTVGIMDTIVYYGDVTVT